MTSSPSPGTRIIRELTATPQLSSRGKPDTTVFDIRETLHPNYYYMGTFDNKRDTPIALESH